MYINNDILQIILRNIPNHQDKLNFCQINSEFYRLNYKNIAKYKIKRLIYYDYPKFYKYLNHYSYDSHDLTELIKFVLIYLNSFTIWMSHTSGTYDLRYIFELMCKLDTYDDSVFKTHENFYRHFYPRLVQNIIPKNRSRSIANLRKSAYFSIFNKNFIAVPKNAESSNYINLIQ